MRDTAIVGHRNFASSTLSRACRAHAEARFIKTALLGSTAANCTFPAARFAGHHGVEVGCESESPNVGREQFRKTGVWKPVTATGENS
jgi:hypothetical protein